MSESWADDFCSDVLTDILSRRINPHLFKASCITYLLEVKKIKIELNSKYAKNELKTKVLSTSPSVSIFSLDQEFVVE
ncbi:hypothetical protein DJ95_1612 [Bacillus atrophaeus subsp. globigii]|nr:hypothetical protein DJ95_1612 [Bacillus atrophaeus subsp. globigii]AKL84822.1 YomM [Bacillus atrophaeus UCMB-5137]EIM11881.1 integrase [Bacillus atrophaeus C89]KFK82938.1 hypothetical protein DK44_2021 [Bacillus atrophaeus]MBU5263330.1 hypothetical protein [Bacillus atrophaeus]